MSTRGADAAPVSEPHPATASGGATTGNAAVSVASGPSTHDDGTTGAITGSGDGPDSGTVDSAVAADARDAGSADGSGHADATPAGGGGEGDNTAAAAAASQDGDVVAAGVSVPGSAGAGGIARDSEGVDGAPVGTGNTDASGQDDQASGSEGGAGDTGGSDGDVVDTPTAPADGVQVPVSGGGGDVASVSSRGAGGHDRGTSSDAASGNSEAAGSGAAASDGSGDEEFVASTPCDRSQDASSDDDDAPPPPPHGVRGAAPSDGDEAEPGSGSDDDDGDDDDDAGVVPPPPDDDAGAADDADASAAAATAEACVDPFRDSGLSPAVQPPMAPTSDVVVTVAQMLRSGHRPPALSEPSPHRAVTGSSRRVVSDADVALQDVDLGGGLSSIDLGTGTGRATAPAVERVRAEAPVHVKRRSTAASLEGKAAEGRSAFRVASGASMGANTVASGSTHRRNGSDYMGALVDVSLDDIGGPRVARTEHTAEFVAAALPVKFGRGPGPRSSLVVTAVVSKASPRSMPVAVANGAIRRGSRVVAVNGRRVEDLTFDQVRNQIARAARPVSITFRTTTGDEGPPPRAPWWRSMCCCGPPPVISAPHQPQHTPGAAIDAAAGSSSRLGGGKGSGTPARPPVVVANGREAGASGGGAGNGAPAVPSAQRRVDLVPAVVETVRVDSLGSSLSEGTMDDVDVGPEQTSSVAK